MKPSSFTRATLAERLAALFSDEPWQRLTTHSDLCLAEGQIGGRQALVVATDPALVLGTFGICECDDFQWALQRARATGAPLVLLLDSAGARLNAGLPIQGALRSLMRALMDARFAELPILAVLGRYAFGAASMFAAAAGLRLHAVDTLSAMSGPKVLEAQRCNDTLRTTLRAQISGAARCSVSAADVMLDDQVDAFASAVRSWLGRPLKCPVNRESLLAERARLRARLSAAGPNESAAPGAYSGAGGLTGSSVPVREGALLSFASSSFGAADALALCDSLDREVPPTAGGRLTLAIDCPGHSVNLRDEALFLSHYLAHLGLSLRLHTRAGADVRLLIRERISGGIYIALAAGASHTELAPGAMVRTLPAAALLQILGDDRPETPDGAAHLEWGVVDSVGVGGQGRERDAGSMTLNQV